MRDLLHDKVFLLSAAQLAEFSPQVLSQFKKTITKPRHVPECDLVDPQLNSDIQKENSAPRAQGTINNVWCEIILDGGCIPCILHYEYAIHSITWLGVGYCPN